MVSEFRVQLRAAYSLLGVGIGLSVLVVFGVVYKNWNAAIWGAVSAMTAGVALFVNIQQFRRKWDDCVRLLRVWSLVGCFIQVAAFVSFIVYLVFAITQHQGLMIRDEGYYITLVWCFITWKWGFLLMLYAYSYRKEIEEYTLGLQ